MPAKEATKTEAQAAEATGLKLVDAHHILRVIGPQPREDGTITGDMADALLRTWFDAGYSLFATHYAGDTPNGVRILYVLIKYELA